MVEMSTAVEQPQSENKILSNIKDNKDDIVILTNGACENEVEPAEQPEGKCSLLQYSREEMLVLEKADLALLRPEYLDTVFDREGRWDPMAWHCGQPQSEVEAIPVGTLEFRKRTRSNAADTKDVDVVLSPQRMSFGNGCAGSKVPNTSSAVDTNNSNNKRLNGLLPKTSKFDKTSERTRDPDREKHLQKLNGYSGNREQIRKAIRDLHENRDRNKDGKEEDETWMRGDYAPPPDYKHQTYKDTKYSNNGGLPNNKRNWNPRRNSERSVDDEPEWFTEGPTSRLDTIELKGFEDDDKIHSTEANLSKEDSSSKGREDELAMDPLGNPEMTSGSNAYTNESMYSTGLQEDWDPTNPKFNVDALLDPDAFVDKEGKDLLEAEKSMNLSSSNGRMLHMDFWAGGTSTSSPKEFPGISPVQRPESSPSAPTEMTGGAPYNANTDVHFGENIATCNLKAMLGVNEQMGEQQAGKAPGPRTAPPANVVFDMRNGNAGAAGPRAPNFDDPIIRQLLQNDRAGVKPPPNEMLLRPDLLQQARNMPPALREMLLQRSQSEHLPPPGPMLPHPGPVPTPRHPVPEHLLRDPRLAAQHDPRIIDPRLVDPRFNMPSPVGVPTLKQAGHPPRNGQELLKAVKKDPAQLDKVISCLENTLKIGQAPPENIHTMTALLREMEKAKSDNIKLQKLQMLANAQHHLNKQHSEHAAQQMHDKTQALKALLRLPGQGGPLMTAPARMAPLPKQDHILRPRGDETIPTRITSHHTDHRLMQMGNKPPGFPMAFTPTSVMIKSSEVRNFMKGEGGEMDPNIQLTPSHVQPSPQNLNPRLQFRANEGGNVPNGRRSPRFDEGPRPVPTIETSRGGVPKLHFPPSAFAGHHPLKGMPPPNFLMHQAHQLAKGMPPQSPHGPHVPSQLLMHELMHSNKPPTFNHNAQHPPTNAFSR